MPDLWIYGAGGLGREVLDAAEKAGLAVAGFIDEHKGDLLVGKPVRPIAPSSAAFVVAIGDPMIRAEVVERLGDVEFRSVIHPSAAIAARASLGPGSIVLANAVVSVDCSLGAHTQVHYGATVGHDSQFADYVTVLPGARVAGGVAIGTSSMIGSGAVVLQGLRIGNRSVIGAGAVATNSIGDQITAVGVPARPLR